MAVGAGDGGRSGAPSAAPHERAGRSPTADRPTLLVLRALGLGDLLTAVPALRALAAAFPDHQRVLAAPHALAPLVELIGAVDELADVHELQPLPAQLRCAEIAVNLHGRGPQSTRLLVEARPGRLIAFDQAGSPRWHAGEHEVARWCRLLAQSAIPADRSRLHLGPPRVASPPEARGATLVHPGAASAARRWPPERFAAVARAEAAAGRHVVVTGGPDEVELGARVVALAGLDAKASLAGRTGLEQLAAAVAAAGRVVCGDTGVGHLATALGTPSVLLFGPTSPVEWGPPRDRARHVVLWSGRTGDPHGERPDPGLLEIGIEAVLAILAREPSRAAAA